jgi:hypothetical protein
MIDTLEGEMEAVTKIRYKDKGTPSTHVDLGW